MEKRALIAVVVSMVILFAWQYYFSPKTPQQATQAQGSHPQTAQTQRTGGGNPDRPEGPAAAGQLAPSAMPQTPVLLKTPAKLVSVDTSKMTVALGDFGGGVVSVRLKEYKETVGGREGKELVQDIAPYQYFPVVSKIAAGQTLDDAVPFTADKRGDIAVRARPETVVLTGRLADGTGSQRPTASPRTAIFQSRGGDGRGGPRRGGIRGFCRNVHRRRSRVHFRGPFVYNGKKIEQVDQARKVREHGHRIPVCGFRRRLFFVHHTAEGKRRPASS